MLILLKIIIFIFILYFSDVVEEVATFIWNKINKKKINK
jgi:hypothetical protein